MKRIAALLSAVFLAILLCGCSAKQPYTDDGKIRVAATVFPAYDLARQVGGDNVTVDMICPSGESGHGYEPSPRELERISGCDIFLYIGGSDEYWAERLVESGALKDCAAIRLSDYALKLDGHEDEDEHHSHEEEELFDPHIWTSPSNMLSMLDAVSDAFCNADKENADIYTDNANDFSKRLKSLISDIKSAAQGADKPIIFADKFAFRYFTEEFGLKYMAAFASCDEHSEPGARTVARLIDTVKEEGIKAVYYFEFNSSKTADVISEETGAKAVMLYSCHTVSEDELDGGEDYISLMRKNLAALSPSLKGDV